MFIFYVSIFIITPFILSKCLKIISYYIFLYIYINTFKYLYLQFFRYTQPGIDVNQILDILKDDKIMDMEYIYLQPPTEDASGAYVVSDTEEGDTVKISWTILQAKVLR